MKQRLNFSPEPFRSGTPMMALWAVNLILLLLLGGALWHWQGLRRQNHSAHNQIDALKQKQAEIAEENGEVVALLENIDVKSYRKQVSQFHEIQRAVQTHWGKLLDSLGELQPEDVRLRELRPRSARRNQRETQIGLVAEARNKEAQLTFIETLQAEPAFSAITFESEKYQNEGVALVFEISFIYLPGGRP